jgi:hypothetical protein
MIKIIRWVFGIGWLVGGIGIMTDTSIVGGILVSLAGLLLLPPSFTFIAQATGKTVSKPVKYISVILLLAVGFSIVAPKQEAKALAEKKAAEESVAEKKKQEHLAYERLSPAAKDSIKRAVAREEKIAKEQQARAVVYEAKKARREKVESQFSSYDGSHHGVERAIKARMNDPDSYEHVQTRFKDMGNYILVYTQFRGKNAFNAKIMNVATAKVDFSGNVLGLEMQ